MNLFWKRIPQTTTFELELANRHESYNTFIKTEKSALLDEYKELAEINFKQSKKEFKNSEDYKASPIPEKEARFKVLSQDSDIKNFLHYNKTNAFRFEKRYELARVEEFSEKGLDKNDWINSFRWSQKLIEGNYSNEDQFQAYTEGKNTETSSGLLYISTKQKAVEGKVWTKDKGFITKPFNFTSDLISSTKQLPESGSVLIKFKLEGCSKALHHFIRAYDDNNQECITLLESLGKRQFNVGHTLRGQAHKSLTNKISGLNLEKDYHILELEWNPEVISWRINGFLVHQDSNVPQMQNMHLVIGSVLTKKKGNDGKIIVDYIRFFKER